MKVHTKTVWQMTADPEKYELLQDEYHEYDGPVAECIGGGSKTPSTTTQVASPWGGVAPYLRDLYGQAAAQGNTMRRLGPAAAASDPMERYAQDMMQREAGSVGVGPYAEGQLQSTLRGNYQDSGLERQSMAHLGGTLGGQFEDPYAQRALQQGLVGTMAGPGGPGQALERGSTGQIGSMMSGYGVDPRLEGTAGELADQASGKYLYGGEGFNAAMDAAAADIMPRVGAQFAGKGMYSSGLRKSAEAKELGRAFAGLYGQERDRQMKALGLAGDLSGQQRQRQMQALGMATGLGESGRGRQMEAMGLATTREQAERQRQMEALGLSTGMYGDERQRQIQALGLAPGIESMRYQPAQVMQAIGEQRRMEQQRMQDAPWEALSRQAALYQGFMSPTTVQKATQPGMSTMGGALAGASVGSMFGPWGTAGGAVLGGLLA